MHLSAGLSMEHTYAKTESDGTKKNTISPAPSMNMAYVGMYVYGGNKNEALVALLRHLSKVHPAIQLFFIGV